MRPVVEVRAHREVPVVEVRAHRDVPVVEVRAKRASKPRKADAARLALGVLCVARPALPSRWSRSERRGTETAVRLLGVRYVAQSLGGPWLHRSWVPAADAAVDLAHAASMLGLAVLAPRHRHLALASAAVATAFAVADLRGRKR